MHCASVLNTYMHTYIINTKFKLYRPICKILFGLGRPYGTTKSCYACMYVDLKLLRQCIKLAAPT